jgi:hypothetical protein
MQIKHWFVLRMLCLMLTSTCTMYSSCTGGEALMQSLQDHAWPNACVHTEQHRDPGLHHKSSMPQHTARYTDPPTKPRPVFATAHVCTAPPRMPPTMRVSNAPPSEIAHA